MDTPSRTGHVAKVTQRMNASLLLQTVDIVKEGGVQFSSDELQKLATTLFIQRTR